MAMTTILDLPRGVAPRGVRSATAGRNSGTRGEVGDGFAGLLQQMRQPPQRSRPEAGPAAEPAPPDEPVRRESPGDRSRARASAAGDPEATEDGGDAGEARDAGQAGEAASKTTAEGSQETAVDAAAAAQLLVPLTEDVVEVAGESVAVAPAAPGQSPRTLAAVAGADSGARGAGGEPRMAPEVSLGGGQPDSVEATVPGGALDLVTPQEMANAEVQLDAGHGQVMERLQRALASGDGPPLDEIGRPLVPQVVRAIATLNRNGMSEMRLQLQPADLGQIELRVRAVDGVVRGEVMVQHPVVKNLLDSQVDRLRGALADQGMQLGGLDVGVSRDGAFAGGPEHDGWRFPGDRRAAAVQVGTPADEPTVTTVPRRPQQLGGTGEVHWLV